MLVINVLYSTCITFSCNIKFSMLVLRKPFKPLDKKLVRIFSYKLEGQDSTFQLRQHNNSVLSIQNFHVFSKKKKNQNSIWSYIILIFWISFQKTSFKFEKVVLTSFSREFYFPLTKLQLFLKLISKHNSIPKPPIPFVSICLCYFPI